MFNGDMLRDAIISAANNISNNRRQVDNRNVFPVPDGDTGTNMSMTMNNAARELTHVSGESAGKVASIVAEALLRGARGNSGVITSLLFRGFAKGLKGLDTIDAESLKNSFRYGVDGAYKAIMKPTEGTILTVSRVAAEYAEKAFEDGKDTLEIFESAIEGAKIALDETPELLPVLKKAGVVDAGGSGYVILLEGMYSVFKNGIIIQSENTDEDQVEETNEIASAYDAEITFTYCTEYIVNRNAECEKDPADLRTYLQSIGDCVVVVDDESIIKVHVHTDHPGNAIEEALTYGQLVHLKIDNMRDEHEKAKHDAQNVSKKPVQNSTRTETYTPATPEKPVGFVSVCAGEGIASLFTDLGVDTVVEGGQTMNPSTDDILKAIETTPAETVFVLPNNKNIIMAAEQAIPLSTRKVIVIHTTAVTRGVSAMLAYNPEAPDDENAIEMLKAAEKIQTGSVTFAARDSDYDGHKIKKGELLALNNGKVSFTDDNIEHCLNRLIKQMLKRDSQFLTVMYGSDVTESDAEEIERSLNEKFGDKVEITFLNGGQPIYYFIFSIE